MSQSLLERIDQKIEENSSECTKLRSEMQAIFDAAEQSNRDLSDSERTLLDEKEARHKELNKARAQHDADRNRIDAQLQWAKDSATAGRNRKSVPAANTKAGNDGVAEGSPPRNWCSLGEQLLAIYAAGDPQQGFRLDDRLRAAVSGSGTTVDADGGFLVQTDFAAGIRQRMYEIGQILSKVAKVQIGPNSDSLKMYSIKETSRANGSRWGGVRVYRKAQADQGTATKPQLHEMELKLKKLFGMWYATDELLADAVAMNSVAQQAFPAEFTFTAEDEIINGDGASQMLGIIHANNPALVSVSKETNQAAATLNYTNLVKMWSRMWAPSRANAVWLINQDVETQLYQMEMPIGTGGVPVFLPPGGLSASPYSTLFGRPIVPVEYCPTLGTKGDVILVDFSQYLMIEKGGVQADSSMHLRFDYGETAFRWILRNDGQPTWFSALTPKSGSSNTLSPYVTLNTRA